MSAKALIEEASEQLDHTLSRLSDDLFYLSPSSRDTEYGQNLENHIDCIVDAIDLLNKALDLVQEDD